MKKIYISTSNKKMENIPSFSVSPGYTCPVDAPCRKDCYACKMQRIYKGVYNTWLNNYNYITGDNGFLKLYNYLVSYCTLEIPPYFRYNVGGDFTPMYFNVTCSVALKCPKTQFFAFTKQFKTIVEQCKNIPINYHVFLSFWKYYRLKLIDVPKNVNICEFAEDMQQAIEIYNYYKNKSFSVKICDCKQGCKHCKYCFDEKYNGIQRVVIMVKH